MRIAIVAPLVALAGIGFARTAREQAKDRSVVNVVDAPYAPAPTSAPFLTLGYRELAADLFFVRLVGYFGSPDNDAQSMAALAETVVALDPQFRRVYEFGAVAMTASKRGVDNSIHLRAIALLEIGAKNFPKYWRFPNLAGQIYLVDLTTSDPAQRREWDQKGALLLESATRKPGSPAESALIAASLRTRLGQQQRAVDGLREMLLITDDAAARKRILEQLAKLADENAEEIAAEMLIARKQLDDEWEAARPALPLTDYLLVGPQLQAGFDLGGLATGGRDLIGSEGFERLEPITDPP